MNLCCETTTASPAVSISFETQPFTLSWRFAASSMYCTYLPLDFDSECELRTIRIVIFPKRFNWNDLAVYWNNLSELRWILPSANGAQIFLCVNVAWIWVFRFDSQGRKRELGMKPGDKWNSCRVSWQIFLMKENKSPTENSHFDVAHFTLRLVNCRRNDLVSSHRAKRFLFPFASLVVTVIRIWMKLFDALVATAFPAISIYFSYIFSF